jgi:hypothetical protein
VLRFFWIGIALLCCASCGGSVGKTPVSPPCDQTCQDQTALLSLRDVIKLAYNLTLQGMPVGMQDETTSCPLSGTVHITGTATSDASQGVTTVNLTYVFNECSYSQADSSDDPTQAFSMSFTGTILETGMLAAQPSTTTALEFQSSSMSMSGTVYDPPIDYSMTDCAITLGQNGNDLGGTVCGAAVATSL